MQQEQQNHQGFFDFSTKEGVKWCGATERWIVRGEKGAIIGSYKTQHEALKMYANWEIEHNPMLMRAVAVAAVANASPAGPLFNSRQIGSASSIASGINNDNASASRSSSSSEKRLSRAGIETATKKQRTEKVSSLQFSSANKTPCNPNNITTSTSPSQPCSMNPPVLEDINTAFSCVNDGKNSTMNDYSNQTLLLDTSVSFLDSSFISTQSSYPEGAKRYRGVSWQKVSKAWISQCKCAGKTTYVGLYNSPEDAARAYDLVMWRNGAKESLLNFGAPVLDPNNPKDKDIIDSRESILATIRVSGSKKAATSLMGTTGYVPVRAGKRDRGSTSQYRGVSWYSTRKIWKASIQVDKKKVYIGRFATEEDAARAYNEYAIRLRGQHATLNVVGETKTYVPPGWNENNQQKKKSSASKQSDDETDYEDDELNTSSLSQDLNESMQQENITFNSMESSQSRMEEKIQQLQQRQSTKARESTGSVSSKLTSQNQPLQERNRSVVQHNQKNGQTPQKANAKSLVNQMKQSRGNEENQDPSSLSNIQPFIFPQTPSFNDSDIMGSLFSASKMLNMPDSITIGVRNTSRLNEVMSPMFFPKGMQSPIGFMDSTPIKSSELKKRARDENLRYETDFNGSNTYQSRQIPKFNCDSNPANDNSSCSRPSSESRENVHGNNKQSDQSRDMNNAANIPSELLSPLFGQGAFSPIPSSDRKTSLSSMRNGLTPTLLRFYGSSRGNS